MLRVWTTQHVVEYHPGTAIFLTQLQSASTKQVISQIGAEDNQDHAERSHQNNIHTTTAANTTGQACLEAFFLGGVGPPFKLLVEGNHDIHHRRHIVVAMVPAPCHTKRRDDHNRYGFSQSRREGAWGGGGNGVAII